MPDAVLANAAHPASQFDSGLLFEVETAPCPPFSATVSQALSSESGATVPVISNPNAVVRIADGESGDGEGAEARNALGLGAGRWFRGLGGEVAISTDVAGEVGGVDANDPAPAIGVKRDDLAGNSSEQLEGVRDHSGDGGDANIAHRDSFAPGVSAAGAAVDSAFGRSRAAPLAVANVDEGHGHDVDVKGVDNLSNGGVGQLPARAGALPLPAARPWLPAGTDSGAGMPPPVASTSTTAMHSSLVPSFERDERSARLGGASFSPSFLQMIPSDSLSIPMDSIQLAAQARAQAAGRFVGDVGVSGGAGSSGWASNMAAAASAAAPRGGRGGYGRGGYHRPHAASGGNIGSVGVAPSGPGQVMLRKRLRGDDDPGSYRHGKVAGVEAPAAVPPVRGKTSRSALFVNGRRSLSVPAPPVEVKAGMVDELPLTLLGPYEKGSDAHAAGSARFGAFEVPAPSKPALFLSISRSARLVRETYGGPSAEVDDDSQPSTTKLLRFRGNVPQRHFGAGCGVDTVGSARGTSLGDSVRPGGGPTTAGGTIVIDADAAGDGDAAFPQLSAAAAGTVGDGGDGVEHVDGGYGGDGGVAPIGSPDGDTAGEGHGGAGDIGGGT